MIIEKIDDKRIIMALTDEDMKDLSLDFSEETKMSDSKLQLIIKQIMGLATEYSGIDSKNKKVYIEAVPNNNGCVIFISFIPYDMGKRKIYKVKHNGSHIYFFDNSENLMCAIKLLYTYIDYIFNSKCYYCYNKYYLVLTLKKNIPYNISCGVNEFGTYIGKDLIKIAEIAEYGNIIEENNAVYKIGKYL